MFGTSFLRLGLSLKKLITVLIEPIQFLISGTQLRSLTTKLRRWEAQCVKVASG